MLAYSSSHMFVTIHVIGSYHVQLKIQLLLQILCLISLNLSFPHKFAETADICNASVWHVGNIVGEETEFQAMFQASSYYPHSICWWMVDALLSLDELWQSFISLFACSYISSLTAAFSMDSWTKNMWLRTEIAIHIHRWF